jgi:hypothetical protein
VIAKGLEYKPDLLSQEYLQVLFNIVHHHSLPVKEEVANLILIHSQEFDDQNSLLEFQKIKNDGIMLNFTEEPNKSSK